MGPCRRTVLSTFVALLMATSAVAQLTPLGTTTMGTARSGGLTAAAYDDKDDVVLQVWEDAAAALSGRFVHGDGTLAGSAFTIASPVTAGDSISYPAVAYSRGSNDRVFFVAFTEQQSSSLSYGQIVRYVAADPAGAPLLGARFPLTAAADAYVSDVAFNPVTRVFLAAWTNASDAWVRPFSIAGVPMGAAVNVSDDVPWVPHFWTRGRSPRVTVDWRRNRYAVEFLRQNGGEFNDLGPRMRLLDGATAQPLDTTIMIDNFMDRDTAAVYLPSADAVLMTWTERLCVGCTVTLPGPQYGRVMSTDPAGVPGARLPLMQDVGGTEVGGPGIDYDPVSNLVLTAAHGTSGISAAILDASGNLLSETFVLPGGPAYANGVSVRAMSGGLFALAYITNGNATLQRVRLATADTPGPRFSNVWSNLDGPSDGATLGRSFDVTGWAIDVATGAGTGVDAVHVWAYPAAGGAAIFLGAATAPVSRPDLGTAFGAQFTDSGFQVHAAGVPAGTYALVAYAHSAVSGAFSPLPAATITVGSRPAMHLDEPSTGATRKSGFDVGGWAIDLSADPGQNGIDVIHVWAYPSAGGSAVFLGVAPVDRPRADVAAIYGAQFVNAGFRVTTAALAPGPYTIVAFAHSTVTDAFTASQASSITVRPAGDPVMTIDTPADGGSAAQPFVLAGWAIDRDAASGPGVDVLHVWAFPTDGGAAVFAGAAATGGARGDVAAIFGPQFAASGYSLAISGLTPGTTYQIAVYARSTVTGTFSQSRVVLVTIAP